MKYLFPFLFVLFLSIPLYAEFPSLQKPKVYQGDEDITGWVMSEKLDGIRGYWDGKQFTTRHGKVLHPPEWFTKDLPPFELDGELWSGRGQFERIQSIVMDEVPSEDWNSITYNLFEVPNAQGNFLARLKKAADWIEAKQLKHVRVIPQIPCKGKGHLDQFLKDIEAGGGEGVVVKDPAQSYFTGRSPHILKVKNFADMEGTVIGINPGKGKYVEVMGSLTVQIDNGKTFKIGTGFSDNERMNPPRVGSIITFKYYGFTKNGKPKFASFMRIRKD